MNTAEKKIDIKLSANTIRTIHEIVLSVSMPAKVTIPVLNELESEINRINAEVAEVKEEKE